MVHGTYFRPYVERFLGPIKDDWDMGPDSPGWGTHLRALMARMVVHLRFESLTTTLDPILVPPPGGEDEIL